MSARLRDCCRLDEPESERAARCCVHANSQDVLPDGPGPAVRQDHSKPGRARTPRGRVSGMTRGRLVPVCFDLKPRPQRYAAVGMLIHQLGGNLKQVHQTRRAVQLLPQLDSESTRWDGHPRRLWTAGRTLYAAAGQSEERGLGPTLEIHVAGLILNLHGGYPDLDPGTVRDDARINRTGDIREPMRLPFTVDEKYNTPRVQVHFHPYPIAGVHLRVHAQPGGAVVVELAIEGPEQPHAIARLVVGILKRQQRCTKQAALVFQRIHLQAELPRPAARSVGEAKTQRPAAVLVSIA
mmetsp:Transcript_14355/g.54145  ORF Transcript_14355/g.54145 Transcript_14355/m.54145 type:complete len:295 (+) Transcript_14355:997-1881(+)|eukprot:scaffold7346_cov245-Pinguiococcus_pyrenoidosus.AAC.13